MLTTDNLESVRRDVAMWLVGIRAVYARITERMQVLSPHLGMPFTRPMGEGLFEVCTKGKEGIGRAFFCTVVGNTIVVFHAFIKKTQKTPHRDLELARRRVREVRRENA